MEREFLNRFFSTGCTIGMMELTNRKQWRDERVVNYISYWRALSLVYKDHLLELSSIEMCIQRMHWGLQYILQGIKPRTFEELATQARDIKLSIASHDERNDTFDEKMSYSKKLIMESMSISTGSFESLVRDKKGVKKAESSQVQETPRRTLKGVEDKVSFFRLRHRSYVGRFASKEGDWVRRVQAAWRDESH